MDYKLEKLEKNQVKFTITLNNEEWDKANEQAFLKEKGKYAIQGFRKGHVPQKVLENMYGKGVFFEEAFNIALPKYYSEALDKEPNIFPVASPDVDVKDIGDNGGMTFTAVVTLKPEVKLGAYKGIKIKKIEYNVTEEDINSDLKKAQDRASRLVTVEGRAVENGDTVIIDYSGSINGVKFEGGTAEKQSLEIGGGSFIPGFEEQVIGMNVNDAKDLNVKFPDSYAPQLAGKNAVFAVKLHEIKKKELPELNDEFAKDVSEFDTLSAYKEDIKNKLIQANAKKADSEFENLIVETITDSSETEIPEVMIISQTENMVKEMEYRLMYQGIKMEDNLKYTGTTLEDLKKSYYKQAKGYVKSRLVIEQIIKAENITDTQEEIDKKLAEQAESVKKPLEEYKKSVNEKQIDYIRNEIIMDKLFAFLKANIIAE